MIKTDFCINLPLVITHDNDKLGKENRTQKKDMRLCIQWENFCSLETSYCRTEQAKLCQSLWHLL